MKTERRKRINLNLILATLQMLFFSAAEGVPLAQNLHDEALQAERDCKPLLLEFSASYCSYCQLLEEEVLNPTLLDQDYDSRVMIRKVSIDDHKRLTDFDGHGNINTDQLAQRYKVYVTPTLLFVDGQGKELAERMVGVTTLEFYGGYLDAALAVSKENLLNQNKCEIELTLHK